MPAYDGITVIAGPCALETYEHTMEMAYKISLVRDAVRNFGIGFGYRGGAWKPRTRYHNHAGEREFEGVREQGLEWLEDVASAYGLPIVTELMSEDDLRHFGRHLEPERDYIQIGARNSQNYALLYAVGGTPFGVLLKSPQHGVDVKEAVGSLQRLGRNRQRVYCVRGQRRFIAPDGQGDAAFSAFLGQFMKGDGQHPDARNINNIGAIRVLREDGYFADNGIVLAYDPSHTFGGKNDEIRRMIGENAIRAVTGYGYGMLEIEVNDRSSHSKVDGDQALLTTVNGVDWPQTNAGQGPGVVPDAGKEPCPYPITLVDIAAALVDYRAAGMELKTDSPEVVSAKSRLGQISWDARP